MKIKKQQFLLICVLLGLIIIAWAIWPPHKEPGANSTNQQTKNTNTTGNQNQTAGNGINGKLMISDKPSKGNLMVVTDTQTIYLSTSRDFSALIGKDVTMTIDGPITNFKLLNIVAR